MAHAQKKKSIESISKERKVLDLLEKYIKPTFKNASKELEKNMNKDFSKV